MTLRIIDTFSGIGGFSLAARWLGGFETVQFVEWETYCQRILAQHFPDTPIHGDISTFYPEPGAADVVCGGFPCQDISTAGKQAGIKQGTRSGLFYELIRVVRLVQPRYVVLENVAAIVANGLDTVLGELAEAGFDAEWACIPASAVGACHQRDRWWLVAYTHNSRSQAARSQQPATGLEQHGELAANSNSQRQKEISCIAHASDSGLERQKYTQWSPAQQLCPDWGGYLSEPVLRRGDDGLSHRVDRLKALGNAVVPQVAMIPLQRVLDHHRGQR